jgi:ActR/RegA family two-component response regulator
VVPILESLKQFPAAYVVWKVSDQVIVYANDFALDAFGTDESALGKTTLWDIIGPLDANLIILESIRSNPDGGPDIHLPDEAFATFKRLDNGALFTAWYRAKDVIESDGSTIYRVALLFTNYDEFEDDLNWDAFITLRASRMERDLAASVAHDLNNALSIFQNEIDTFFALHKIDSKEFFQFSFQKFSDIGLKMRQLAHISESVASINSDDLLSRIMPDPKASMSRSNSEIQLRVLVVDDEPALVSGLCSVMEIRGIRTLSASTAKEACIKASAFKPHAALIDIVLGDDDGLELGKQLVELFPNIKIVHMTGFAKHALVSASRDKTQVLKKPFEIDLAISLLKEGLADDNRD